MAQVSLPYNRVDSFVEQDIGLRRVVLVGTDSVAQFPKEGADTTDSLLDICFDGCLFGPATPDLWEVLNNFNGSSGDFYFRNASFDSWCNFVYDL